MSNIKTIGGREVAVGFMPALTAVRVEANIMKLCGPALFTALSAAKKSGGLDIDNEEFGSQLIASVASGLNPELLESTILDVMKYVSIDGKRVVVDEAFSGGRNKDLWQVLFFALRYNFADFFPESLFKLAPQKAVSDQSNLPT